MPDQVNIQHTYKPSYLEQFGLFYLKKFKTLEVKSHLLPDDIMVKKTKIITLWAMLASGLVGVICVWPMIKIDVHFTNAIWYIHYGWVALATIVFTLIEFYVLFIISLYSVHRLSQLTPVPLTQSQFYNNGPFNIANIIARAALEIDEPKIQLHGIDPFKQISKRNILILSLLYKLKIILTNTIVKWSLYFLVGKEIFGISVLYEALPVEFLWSAFIVYKIIVETRLRLFGYTLANIITADSEFVNTLTHISPNAQEASLRAIANIVVMTKNYHPNMVMLFMKFNDIIKLAQRHDTPLDDWQTFIKLVHALPNHEKYFVLDILTVAIAFDGNISNQEQAHLKEAYQNHFDVYNTRLHKLLHCLDTGQLNLAKSLCVINQEAD